MKVYFNTSKEKDAPRKLIEVELVKEYLTTIDVRMPDGYIIKRRKDRDLPDSEEKK